MNETPWSEEPMKKGTQVLSGAAVILTVATGVAVAQQLTVAINHLSADGVGQKIGTVSITEDSKGVAFKVAVSGIAAGKHDIHVQEKGDGSAADNGTETE